MKPKVLTLEELKRIDKEMLIPRRPFIKALEGETAKFESEVI